MEYRKMIKFGNSSFVISLPKDWIDQHNLKKGDPVYLDMSNNGEILLTPKLTEIKKEKKSITIDINNKDIFHIQREITAAYINNYHNIVITGDDLSEKSLGIRDIINNLVALEIMEQTSKRITAKDFLDMDNISITNIVRKVDMILRSMMYDLKTMHEEGKKVDEVFNSRDRDINRLTFLALRTIRYGIDDTNFIKKNKLMPHYLLELYDIVKLVEKIGDEVKRIARLVEKSREDVKTEKQKEAVRKIFELFTQIENVYVNAMKSYYKKDRSIAFEIAKKRSMIKNKIEDWEDQETVFKQQQLLMQRLQMMLTYVHDISRISYQ
ncbi:phosphate uptake regulator PhoU [Candidatus Woesearchaeota archaeon]|nr:MAG: phosphate uptake regulator PhoU [Candidatus Woesearchaeota archaeon]